MLLLMLVQHMFIFAVWTSLFVEPLAQQSACTCARLQCSFCRVLRIIFSCIDEKFVVCAMILLAQAQHLSVYEQLVVLQPKYVHCSDTHLFSHECCFVVLLR